MIKSICLSSSYKLTLNKIKKNIIAKTDDSKDPIINKLFLFENIFFSYIGNKKSPKIIRVGNLKNNHIGM